MKIGIVGFGHLGKSLAKGLLYKNLIGRYNLFALCHSDASVYQARSEEFGIGVAKDINDLINTVDVIFWTVKKDAFFSLCQEMSHMPGSITNVSFMAGVTIDEMHAALGPRSYVTRAMPSIAIARADGVIGYTPINNAPVKHLFHELGFAFEVEEKDIEKVTVYSASGLGFAAYVLDAFQMVGEEFGFDPKLCEIIVAKTFISAIDMADYKETARAVSTKGGCTEQGIDYLQQADLNGIVAEAIQRAYDKVLGLPPGSRPVLSHSPAQALNQRTDC